MRRFLLLVGLCALAAPAAAQADADLILTGGEIVTMDEDAPRARALAVEDGAITAIGDPEDVDDERGPGTEVVDLRGKTVIPGLQDSHIHFVPLGWELANSAELTFALSQQDVLDAVRARAAAQPGGWIVGNRWDEYKYAGGMVTRWQLDEIAPDRPVSLDRVYRGVAVNTMVLSLMGIRDDDPSTWPSWWLQDPADFTFEDKILRAPRTITVDGQTRTVNVPTGVFVGSRASALVTARPPEMAFEDEVASLRDGSREMLRLGVTAIVDASQEGGDAYREAARRGWLQPLRVANMYEGTFRTHAPDAIGARLDRRAAEGKFGGDRFLRMTGVKFYTDGGVGTRSAWLSQPFNRWQEIERERNFGVPVVENDAYRLAQFREAARRGWSLHSHATGDRGMRQVTDQYMKLIDGIRITDPDFDPRWSIEHAYLPLEPRTMTVFDMAEYGIIASVQPVFGWQLGQSFRDNLGTGRFARLNPIRSYRRAGVTVAAGSDYGVAHYNPWLGVYAMLTRNVQGTRYVSGPAERVGIEDALRAYTINGAYATFDDDIRGSLRVGKLADLAVLDIPSIRELDANPSLALRMDERVLWTLVEGRTGYRRQPSQSRATSTASALSTSRPLPQSIRSR